MIGGPYEASTMSHAETAVSEIAARLAAHAVSRAMAMVPVNSGRVARSVLQRARRVPGSPWVREDASIRACALRSAVRSVSVAGPAGPAPEGGGLATSADVPVFGPAVCDEAVFAAPEALGTPVRPLSPSVAGAVSARPRTGVIVSVARARTRGSWLARTTRVCLAASAIMAMMISALSSSRWAVGSSRTSRSASSRIRARRRTRASRRS
ncbi:Uncharacterised protein [Mycobacteroides abscessus subsp. abscessus]|nr:Uncharacterised protein [Mycobacteroides abscessus subsp. abscessus]